MVKALVKLMTSNMHFAQMLEGNLKPSNKRFFIPAPFNKLCLVMTSDFQKQSQSPIVQNNLLESPGMCLHPWPKPCLNGP